MPKILEKQALTADLAAVRDMLNFKNAEDDPIGRMAYEERAHSLSKEIASLETQSDTLASVALLFGGEPVLGSRAINADFATEALHKFQDLVSKLHADRIETKGLANMGKVPHRSLSTLQITDVAHGSFGFLLEEKDADLLPLLDSPLKETLDEAASLIASFYAERDADYVNMVDSVNRRIFSTLKGFFEVLYNARATARIVEGAHDEQLDRPKIERAYDRSQKTTVDEEEIDLDGVLIGIIPTKMEFEFQPDDYDQPIVGKTGPAISRSYLERIHAQEQVVGSHTRAKVQVTTRIHPTGQKTIRYTLLDLPIP